MIYEREFVNEVTGTITLVELKKSIAFCISPLPHSFIDLQLFVFKKASQYDVMDFTIEIRAGKEFLEVKDDDSYEIIKKRLHEDAGKKSELTGLKIRVVSNQLEDRVCHYCFNNVALGINIINAVNTQKA